jgi:hypothetical protein
MAGDDVPNKLKRPRKRHVQKHYAATSSNITLWWKGEVTD